MPRAPRRRRHRPGAAITGNIIGNMLGTDDKGKAALGQALGNLARAGARWSVPMPPRRARRRRRRPLRGRSATRRRPATSSAACSAPTRKAGPRSAPRSATWRAPASRPQATRTARPRRQRRPMRPRRMQPNAGRCRRRPATALGGALGGSQRVTPVDFRTLGELLPASLNGMSRGADRRRQQAGDGRQGLVGQRHATAERRGQHQRQDQRRLRRRPA